MYRRCMYPFAAVVIFILVFLLFRVSPRNTPQNGEGPYDPKAEAAQRSTSRGNQQPDVHAGHPHEDRPVAGESLPNEQIARPRDPKDVQAKENNDEEKHLPPEQDILTDELIGEHISRFERGGLSLGNPAYFTGRTLATRARATEYSALVKPIGGIKFFDEIEVASGEVQAKAETIKMTAMVTERTSEERSRPRSRKQQLEQHGDDVVIRTDTIKIKEQLDQRNLSMLTYDQALLGAMNTLVDARILNSFFEKNALAPRKDLISFEETWDQKGLMLTILVDGNAYAVEAFPEMNKAEYATAQSQIHEDISNSVQLEIGLRSFVAKLDMFVSPTERQQYFPDQNGFNRLSLLQFLKSKAEISEAMPAEMRELISHRAL